MHTLGGHDEKITDIDISSDGRYLASSSLDGTILIRDIESGDIVEKIEDVTRSIYAVCLSPDMKRIALGAWEEIIGIVKKCPGPSIVHPVVRKIHFFYSSA